MSFSQPTIQRTYERWAKPYAWLTPVYLMGNEKRLRRWTIDALHLEPGQSVLDVACGTGRNFPFILDAIGPGGELVGADYTPAMLAQAEALVNRSGWDNVRLLQGDAAQLDLGRQFDAVLCTLALSVIPDYEQALQRLLAHVRPGGWIAIADARHSKRWYARPANLFADLLGRGAAAHIERRPWTALQAQTVDFSYRDWFMGFYYVAAGQKSRTTQA